jgi:hypothetical protein
MVLIALCAQWVNARRDEACEISTLTLLSGLRTHGPCKVALWLCRGRGCAVLHGQLPHHRSKICSMTPITTPPWHP